MIHAFSAADVRAAEGPLLAAEAGFAGGLMHRAATALAAAARAELVGLNRRVAGGSVVALVGGGNNGGDALVALALLAGRGVRTTAVLTSPAVHEVGLAWLVAAGGQVLTVVEGAPGTRVWAGDALAEAFAADVVLDGLLGIGGRGELRGEAATLVRLLGELRETSVDARGRQVSRVPRVVAVDVPSGVGVDDGTVPGPVLAADRTLTFGAMKAGLLLPPAARLAGDVELVDLGLGPHLAARAAGVVVSRLDAADVRAGWPVPDAAAQKYTRGVLGVVAGSRSYPGAAVLAVAGALGTGCGMVRYVGPETVADAVRAAHPEVVAGGGRVQAWLVGPGVPPDDADQLDRVRRTLALAAEADLPVVVDAGGLGVLPDRVGPRTVITPHAGELADLLSARGATVERAQVEAEPLRWAQEAHRLTGATVLLKGAVTVVAGDGVTYSQAEATPWLATAGAGDVLAGVLGALLAAASDSLTDTARVAWCAAAAASVHGRAAREANPGGPVTASTVASSVPRVLAGLLVGLT
ncbi:MAG TPA: NAD(P)H-hydrate dehydratase [Actinotalea sp.]